MPLQRLATLPMRCFVLFCFWAGAQLLNLLVHAPGVYERLMQVQETGRPRVEIGLGVGTIFRADPISRLPHFCSGGAMAALATSPPVRLRCQIRPKTPYLA